MKYLIFFLFLLLFSSCKMIQSLGIEWSVQLIIIIIVGFYEVLARAIPSIANYSFIAKVIDVLKFISDSLNKRKKKR